jgi:hypothetical protein
VRGVLGRRGRRERTESDLIVIDLSDHVGSSATEREQTPEDRARVDAYIERRRTELRKREAERELAQLRARHWSADRVIEESRLDMDFWAHDLADPFAVLGLLPGATLEEAAAARKRIARECHPDLTKDMDPAATVRMRAANAAYERIRRAIQPRN